MRRAPIRPIVLMLLAACATNPAPVPLSGDQAGLAQLAGRWTGDYSSGVTGRSGSIVFTLEAGEQDAHGDVVMVPRGSAEPLRPSSAQASGGALPSVLTIDFVRISDDQVSGTLAPYTDPGCNCPITTTFTGRLSGNVIRGTFASRRAGIGQPITGNWEVRRRS